MDLRPRTADFVSTLLLALCLVALPALAAVPPAGDSAAEQLSFDDPGMYILNYYQPLDALPGALQQSLSLELDALGVPPSAGYYDLRADRWGSLILTVPLIPGSGVGNALAWADLGRLEPASDAELGQAARAAFESFLASASSELRIDPEELGSAQVTVLEGGRLIQINLGRVSGDVPVEGSYVHGVVNNGNLVLYGTRNWGDIGVSSAPTVTSEQARSAASGYAAPAGAVAGMRAPALKLYPMRNGDTPSAAALGAGFDYRLTWEVQLTLAGSEGTWRALVDAETGELYSFADQNRYATRKVTGGVQPVSNDGLSPNGVPDGQEQDDWPMPFADIWIDRAPASGPPDTVTNSGGVMACVDGAIATGLAGPFVRMNDACGAANESVAAGDLELGSGATAGTAPWMPPFGTDCARPVAGSSAGNTHSSRDGFYEVNRIKEMARGWLPDNFWLTGQLTANMNINNTCNAFWNGSTINFYRDSNSSCRNTGEIAAIFDHEWGHGMDANDAFAGISFPGETIADQYAMFRLNTSCIGRGFFKGGPCGGQGDACLECTGVREVDWSKRASGLPHNISWIKQPVVTPVDGPLAPRGGCVGAAVALPVLQSGPCLQSTHCEGSVVSEAVWDLMHRDLNGFEGSAFTLDSNTRINLVTRLGYLGGGNVNFWFQCVDTPEDGTGGCNSDGGYMNFLAADDDNGNLLDGTPHMSAIHDAFARHQMACPAPTVADTGCSGDVPATPNLTATALDNGAELNWSAVPGATEYWLFRADGINGCEFGKERIAVTGDTRFVDSQLLNGREYYYTVEAVGATSDSCRSAASVCEAVTPVAGANLKIREGSVTTEILGGDNDQFLDNCESAVVSFELENNGNLPLSNVQIVSVESPSHPGVSAAETLPIAAAASLTDCDSAPASLTIAASGLAFDDTLVLRVGFTADQFGGVVRTETIEIRNTESDFTPTASHTFAFNEFGDFEGWELVVGNYDQLPGGPVADPGAPPFFLGSSTFLPDQCDAIQSPLIKLTGTSTLSLYNQYDTEPPLPVFGGTFYDRANVGILDTATGVRTTVVPDGGRPYDIPAGQEAGGSCFTADQRGWSDAGQLTWQESTWSPAALQTGSFAGQVVRLHVAYGTDALVQGAGFQFDLVTFGDIEMQGPDGQSDACSLNPDAIDDDAFTPFETAATIDVVDNDVANDTVLTVTEVTEPANGSVVNNDDGTVTYTPDPSFIGIDTFQYTVCNSFGCDTATVTVEVGCPPEPTGSFADDFEPDAEPGWTVDTAANNLGPLSPTWDVTVDLSAHSPTMSFSSDASNTDLKDDRLVSPPMDLSSTSQLIFWHRFNTEDGFDGGVLEVSTDGGSSWADVGAGNIVSGGYNGTIDPGFGSPIANRPAWTGLSDFLDAMNQVVVDLGSFAGNGVLVRWRLVLDPLVPGALPGGGWWVDDVQFTNLNETPPTCDPPPVANDDAYSVSNAGTLNVAAPGVLENDTDDGPITAVLDSGPSFAAGFTLNPDGSFDYTHDGTSCPAPGEDDSFTYHANDGESDSNIATVSIDVICNNPPQAIDDGYGVDDDATLVVPAATGVLANDTDPDAGDTLVAELVSGPTTGVLVSFNPDGSFEYEPADACGDGTDTFFYQACDRPAGDPERLCDGARVTISINDANQPPEPRDDEASTTVDTAIDIDVFADNGNGPDGDPDGDSFSIFNVTAPANGSASENPPPPGNVRYTPNPGFIGSDSFSYTICDECGLCAGATVTVTVGGGGNLPPEPVDDTASTSEDTAVEIDVLENDIEPDDDPMTVIAASDPLNGSVVINGTGPDNTVTYTPDPGFFGVDEFIYTVCDDKNACATATVTVTVTEGPPGEPCDFCAGGEDPVELDLTYLGGDCSSSDNTQGDKAECTDFAAGPPPVDQPVFIVVSSKEDSGSDSDDEFFRGPVDPGQAVLLSAAFAGKNDLPSKVFVHIFSEDTETGGVVMQTNEIHTSCSAPLIEGERFGAVQLGDAGNPGECPAASGGRVHGGGHLDVLLGLGDDEDSDTDADSDSDDDSDSDKIHFSFDARFKNGALKGKLKLKDKEFGIKIDADKNGITSLNTGTGDCNGQPLGANSWELTVVGTFEQDDVEIPGATFRVCGEDNGKPGKDNDRFFLECLSGCSYDTGSRVPDDFIDGGNIHIHDALAGSG